MDALTLNYSYPNLFKTWQRLPYPPKALCQIAFGIRRLMVEKNPSLRAGSLVWAGNRGQRRQSQPRTGEAGEKNLPRPILHASSRLRLPHLCPRYPIQKGEHARRLKEPSHRVQSLWTLQTKGGSVSRKVEKVSQK